MSAPSFNRRELLTAATLGASIPLLAQSASAQDATEGSGQGSGKGFSSKEIVDRGHRFFGTTSRGLANVVENAFSKWGQPTGYILGQEGAGAFVAGLRYGEGKLYSKTSADSRIYWQGPSLGFDFGGDGDRTMMLCYRMRSAQDMYKRFVGVDGSAYLVGGFGMTLLSADPFLVVPIRTGLGARLGVNMGYLKFTSSSTWNPF